MFWGEALACMLRLVRDLLQLVFMLWSCHGERFSSRQILGGLDVTLGTSSVIPSSVTYVYNKDLKMLSCAT